MLPQTNFSSLSAAAILDSAAASSVSIQQLQPLMQLYQQLWCNSNLQARPLPNMTTVQFANVTLFVYNSNDIVSGQLKGSGHSWEANEIKEMLWAVRQFGKQQELMKLLPARATNGAATAASMVTAGSTTIVKDEDRSGVKGQQHDAANKQASSSSSSSSQPPRPLMIDVGSNVGWFALNAAAAGARVAAFEAMDSNLGLLRRSLCASPWLSERITLFGTGLGAEAGTCKIISGIDNMGDGHAVCNKSPEQALRDLGKNTTEYKVRGEISIRRLDSLIQEDVQVMKIDVEGFELNVLRGAQQLLQRYNVWYIMLECNRELVGGHKGLMVYLRFLDDLGYSISGYSFSGPFLSAAHIKDGSVLMEGMNLYCVRKDLRHAQLALKAGVTPPG